MLTIDFFKIVCINLFSMYSETCEVEYLYFIAFNQARFGLDFFIYSLQSIKVESAIQKHSKINMELPVNKHVHFWYGCIDTPHNDYRKHVSKFRIITDNLRIIRDKGNSIPNKSWMLYLLEIFNTQRVAVELNLICQFDNQNYFEAIFKGHNQYRFKKVSPQVGHSYHREINFLDKDSTLEFYLKDLNSNEDEKFFLKVDRGSFSFQFHQSFTGVEWWNRVSSNPYPIRYEIEISNLMYGYNDDLNDPNSKVFFPISSIYENKDNTVRSYPAILSDIIRRNGCICYLVS